MKKQSYDKEKQAKIIPPSFINKMTEIEEIVLNEIIDSIQSGKAPTGIMKKYGAAYKISFNLGGSGGAENESYTPFLYEYYQDKISEFIENHTSIKLKNKLGKELLSEFLAQWGKINLLIYWLKKIFLYLDSYYLKEIEFEGSLEEKPTLSSKGLEIFFNDVFKAFCVEVVGQIFKEIEAEREGNLVDWERIQKVITCYRKVGMKKASIEKEGNEIVWKGEEDLKYYNDLFEPKYIEYTSTYYREHASTWFSKQSTPEFVMTALSAFKHEEDKILKFLDKATLEKLNSKLVDEIIKQYDKKLTDKENTGCAEMFKNKRLDELKNIYLLFKKNPESHRRIIERMKPYIIERSENIKKNPDLIKDPVKFINDFISLKKEFYDMLAYSFEKSPEFSKAIDFTFCNVLQDCSIFPQYLANYADNLLRVEIKGKQESQEELLNDIMYFVTCINQKDVFLTHYSKFLANRLLNGTSLSKEAETTLISKLTVECGFNNVNKLQKMVEDINSSATLQSEFKSHILNTKSKMIELEVKVLSTANWPEQKIIRFPLPGPLNQSMQKFEMFYKHKESRKNIFWLFAQGNCEIKTNYLNKSYNLISTVFQYAILDQFNNKDSITYSDLSNVLKISNDDISNSLRYLYIPTRPLILKENLKVPTCQPNENLGINLKFVSQSLKIVLTPTAPKATTANTKNEEMENQINTERGTVLDCIIVRIMKGRKTEQYNNIISEVIHQCNMFKPEPGFIKQRIESLLEREFLKRDDNNRNVYIYCP